MADFNSTPVPQPFPKRRDFQNLTGRAFGKLTVLFYAGRHKKKYSLWHCRCKCGRETTLVSSRLTLGQTTSCTYCFRHKPKPNTRADAEDLTGWTFGRLVVESLDHRVKGNQRRTYWRCSCECGESTVARGDSLKGGFITSCGCLNVVRKWTEQPAPATRICSACNKELPLTNEFFYPHPTATNGLLQRCKECRNASNRKTGKKHRLNSRKLVINAYGGDVPRCSCCGEDSEEFLTIDHINGDGAKHRKEVGNVYDWLVRNNFPPGFRVLCYNCNLSLGRYGYCPHNNRYSPS